MKTSHEPTDKPALVRLLTPNRRHASGPGAAWFAVACVACIGGFVAAASTGNRWWGLLILGAAAVVGREAVLRLRAGNL